jgi:hypothetical protein
MVEPGPWPAPTGTTVEGWLCWPTTWVDGDEGSSAGGVPIDLSLGIWATHGFLDRYLQSNKWRFPKKSR